MRNLENESQTEWIGFGARKTGAEPQTAKCDQEKAASYRGLGHQGPVSSQGRSLSLVGRQSL